MKSLLAIWIMILFLPSLAEAAGVQQIVVSGPAQGVPDLEGAVWSPCSKAPSSIEFRGVELEGFPNCAIDGEALPLIVISHGARGWFGGHHDTAAALADEGYIVAAVTHPDRGRTWQTNRPAAVKALIDFMLKDWSGRDHIDETRVGFFGFSRGAYTGLVLVGGEPSFRKLVFHCLLSWSDPMCKSPPGRSSSESEPATIEGFTRDTRIKAAVIAAPVGLVFSDDRLNKVNVPMQLWRAEKDQLLIYPNHAELVYESLPESPEYHIVPGAGHFAFLPPCNDVQKAAVPHICEDAADFDRDAFHQKFNAEVVQFFDKQLGSQ